MSKFIAFIILVGVVNATIIEPALCYQHEEADIQQEVDSCCSVCHPAHHQGIIPTDFRPNFTDNHSVDFLVSPQYALFDSPVQSTFHPPLAS